MILDGQNQFSDDQALTATAVSANVIDLGAARSIGSGEPLAVVFTVSVDADQTTGDEDYQFDVKYATNAALTSGEQLLGRRIFESGTPTAPAQNADLLVAGYKFYVPIPPVTLGESARYLGVEYTLSGTSPSVTVSAHLIPMSFAQSEEEYANGYDIA